LSGNLNVKCEAVTSAIPRAAWFPRDVRESAKGKKKKKKQEL